MWDDRRNKAAIEFVTSLYHAKGKKVVGATRSEIIEKKQNGNWMIVVVEKGNIKEQIM